MKMTKFLPRTVLLKKTKKQVSFFFVIYTHFKNSLVIHEGNTKQISTMTVTFIYEVGSWTYTGVVLDDMVV